MKPAHPPVAGNRRRKEARMSIKANIRPRRRAVRASGARPKPGKQLKEWPVSAEPDKNGGLDSSADREEMLCRLELERSALSQDLERLREVCHSLQVSRDRYALLFAKAPLPFVMLDDHSYVF